MKTKLFFDDEGYSIDSTKSTWNRIYTVINDSSFLIENFKSNGTPILSAQCYCESYKRKIYVDAEKITTDQFKYFANQCKPVYDGEVKQFYDNGKVEFIGPYSKGIKQGTFTYWYWNGNKKGDYLFDDSLKIDFTYKIINHFDSLGKQQVFSGEGDCVLINKVDNVIESGKIVQGVKHGEWKGTAWKGKLSYREEYKSGSLLKGLSVDSVGTQSTYEKIIVNAEYNGGGYQGLARLVGQNIKYPAKARRLGIEGTVYVQFVIDKLGQLTDVEVIKGIQDECDNEAKRVLLLASQLNFTPGYYRGKQVRMKYVLPVKFRLE